MNNRQTLRMLAAVAAGVALAAGGARADEPLSIDGATGTVDRVTLNWHADPGSAYCVVGTSSLTDPDSGWEQSSGTLTASGWSLEQAVNVTNDVMFFRVKKVDVTGPTFQFLDPEKDAVAVATDAVIRIAIADDSGVMTTNGLGIYVGDAWHPYVPDADEPDVTWEDGVLSFVGGNLGAPGEEVEVWATANDVLGNPGRCESSRLTLASELRTVPFVVIGKDAADVSDLVASAGESGGAGPAAKAASVSGTIWIAEAGTNTLTFGYTDNGWQLLAVDQLWASEDPDNIFYRRITELGDPDGEFITAMTAEATLADFFDGGSFNSDNGEWTEYDVVDAGEGEEVSAQSRRRAVRPRVSGSTSKYFYTNGVLKSDWLNNALSTKRVPLEFVGNLGEWDVGAGFGVAADFALLKRKFNTCDLSVTGKVHVCMHPKLVATTNAAYSNTWTKTIADVKKTFGGTIGPVPVWVDIRVEVPVALTVQAQATNATVEAKIDISRSLDFRWHLSDDQWRQLGNGNPGWIIAQTNFDYEVTGSAGVRASIKPTLTIKVYSLVGAYGWVEPYLEANAVGRVQGHNLIAPDYYYLLTAYAGLNAEIGLASTIWSESWGEPPHKTFSPLRIELLHLEGTNTPPSFASKPADYTAEPGETVMLSALAKGSAPLRYSWAHNGKDTGRRDSFITMTASEATAGNYTVTVRNGYGVISNTVAVTLATNTPVVTVIGAWRFLYQWEGMAANSYVARFYPDGSMHDTSPSDYWWEWHVNGKTVRIETREKWNGQSAVYRGARWNDKFMSGTMTSPDGRTGTWSMNWISADPDADPILPRALPRSEADTPPASPFIDPAGRILSPLAAE